MGVTVPTQEIAQIAQQVQTLVEERPARITTEVELNAGIGWLAQVRKRRKEWEAFFSKLAKPFREAIADYNRQRDNMLDPLRKYEDDLDSEIRNYRALQAKKAAEAQRKLDEQYERRIDRAVEKGQDPALVKPPPVVAAPPKTVGTPGGQVSFPKHRKFKVRDPNQVPDEYWIIDEVKVGKAVRAGIDVPGCDIWEEETSAIR